VHGWVRSIDYAGENPPAEYPNGSEPFSHGTTLILKDKLQSEFDNPVAVECGGDLPPGRLVDIRAWRLEHRVVEQVEDLSAALQTLGFGQRDLFADGDIDLLKLVCSQDVLAAISECVYRRYSERFRRSVWAR
jgi:hypothetical protein